MQLVECSPPEESRLAVYVPQGGLHGYERAINDTLSYWQQQERQAAREGEYALYDMSKALREQLEYGTKLWKHRYDHNIDRTLIERARRVTLSTLAVGLLLRSQWAPTTRPGDAISAGEATTLLDMYAADRVSMPLDFRIHTEPVSTIDTPAEAWYQTDNVYVRQVRPAEPTDYLQSFVVAHNVRADFDRLETLYPYVPSRT